MRIIKNEFSLFKTQIFRKVNIQFCFLFSKWPVACLFRVMLNVYIFWSRTIFIDILATGKRINKTKLFINIFV